MWADDCRNHPINASHIPFRKFPVNSITIPAAIIIGREITISALREWMAEIGARAQIAVSAIGKIKTAFQMVAIIFLVYRDDLFGLPVYTIGFVLLYVAVILTLWSMVLYIRGAWPSLNGEHESDVQSSVGS